MKTILKIGNAQAFWGDSTDAAATLLQQQPDLDYITLDYLSEVSLSIMAVQRSKDPAAGYARDFVDVVASLIPFWKQGSKVKLITNAGGLDPKRCALACAEALRAAGCFLPIGIVTGDDVLALIKSDPDRPSFENLETGESIRGKLAELSTANAYLGASPIVKALKNGAHIVITGRVADPSLTVAPCIAHYGWDWKDYDRIAQATLAGHLIECGTQATGGISTEWLEIPDIVNIGFPFVEVEESGAFVITKPPLSGGRVSLRTVKEQMLYEIGDPSAYLSPDVTLSLLNVSLEDQGENRVKVMGAKGRAPPPTLKVSATYRDGYKAEGMLALFGRNAKAKARRCGEMILERVKLAGFDLERTCIECLGGGDLVPGIESSTSEPLECMLRICIADHRLEALECFSRQIAPMVTAGPPGTTGYTTGRPRIRPVFGYWPCLVNAEDVRPHVEAMENTNE